jgi:formate-dependent nitrite reductase membrane component NrfD
VLPSHEQVSRGGGSGRASAQPKRSDFVRGTRERSSARRLLSCGRRAGHGRQPGYRDSSQAGVSSCRPRRSHLALTLGGAIRTVNYALYSATIAALVLIADDLAHPTSFSNEIERVLYTFAGLAIGVGLMFLADLLSKKRSATAAPAAA